MAVYGMSTREAINIAEGNAKAPKNTPEVGSLLALVETLVGQLGTDSVGNLLPAGFDALSETYGYTGEDLTTIVKTSGANTYTQTLTYAGGKLTATSKWVKA